MMSLWQGSARLSFCFVEAVCGFDVVDRSGRIRGHRYLKCAVLEPDDGVDRHIEVFVFAFAANQKIMRMDLADRAENGATVAHDSGTDRNVACAMRVVAHYHSSSYARAPK